MNQMEMRVMDTVIRELPKIRKALVALAPEPDLTELTGLVTEARRAADYDSNDAEIVALQMALEAALELVPGWKDPS